VITPAERLAGARTGYEEAIVRLDSERREATARWRQEVDAAREAGLTLAECADAVGLDRSRIWQLTRSS
jgi:hypothetical protein